MSKYKWSWMMDYCKIKQIPPAENWAWSRAEKKYNEQHDCVQSKKCS